MDRPQAGAATERPTTLCRAMRRATSPDALASSTKECRNAAPAAFWRAVQERLKEGEVLEVLPYHPHRVRVASSA